MGLPGDISLRGRRQNQERTMEIPSGEVTEKSKCQGIWYSVLGICCALNNPVFGFSPRPLRPSAPSAVKGFGVTPLTPRLLDGFWFWPYLRV
jgi:hypothetical protein